MLIYKKSFKKCLRLLHKTFSNCEATYQKELYLLFQKSGNFSQSEHRDRFDSFPPPVCFHLLFKDTPPPSTTNPGFSTGVESMGGAPPQGQGSLKFDWGALVNSWREHRSGLKIQLKNTCGRVYLIVKLPAISLQACKFTKNELLYSYL